VRAEGRVEGVELVVCIRRKVLESDRFSTGCLTMEPETFPIAGRGWNGVVGNGRRPHVINCCSCWLKGRGYNDSSLVGITMSKSCLD